MNKEETMDCFINVQNEVNPLRYGEITGGEHSCAARQRGCKATPQSFPRELTLAIFPA